MKLKPFSTLLLCAALIAYASLFPCTGWRLPEQGMFAWCVPRLPGHISKSDFLVNIIAYLPLGYLAQRFFSGFAAKEARLCSLLVATAAGAALSFTLESLQSALPNRNPSVIDLGTNTFGAWCGAACALLWQRSLQHDRLLARWRERHLLPGESAVAGAGILALWALSQWSPFVPSLDPGSVKSALKPLWLTARDLSRFDLPHAATYCCFLAGLGVVAQRSLARHPLPCFALFASAVLAGKLFVSGRVLSLEAVTGLLGALFLLPLLCLLPLRAREAAAALATVAGVVISEVAPLPGTEATAPRFNWLPFHGQLVFELNGMGSILEGLYPFAALSFLLLSRREPGRGALWTGGILMFLMVLALEALQLSIPGRSPDITPAILAFTGWLLPFLRRAGKRPDPSPAPAPPAPP